MITTRIPRCHGFTLVELLMGIAIIALLLSILLPVLHQARHSARTVQCASNLKQVHLAILHYAEDSQGHLPPVWNPIAGFWTELIAPYHSAPADAFRNVSNHFELQQKTALICPNKPATGAGAGYYKSGYGMRYDWLDPTTIPNPLALSEFDLGIRTPTRLNRIRRPAEKALAGDSNQFHLGTSSPSTPVGQLLFLRHPLRQLPAFTAPPDAAVANVLFCDGHVGRVGYHEAVSASATLFARGAK